MLESSMFQNLPSWHQAEVLTRQGTLLAQRRHNGWLVSLYALDNSFIELWSGTEAEVVGMFSESASALEILEPYTHAIDIDEFLR